VLCILVTSNNLVKESRLLLADSLSISQSESESRIKQRSEREPIRRFLDVTGLTGASMSIAPAPYKMSDLLSLPLEILVEISSYLTTADLGALRLTCTQVERSLWDWFAKEFFAKKQFMITQQSSQALVDISHHSSLSKILKHVIISTLVYDTDNPSSPGFSQYTVDVEFDLR
jgi:hypothetical protein